MSDEIEIMPYQPEWPALFAAERLILLGCLPNDMVLDIAHFGSTAIPGMAAKPIIDILVAVRSVTDARNVLPTILARWDYDFWADNPNQDCLFFVKGLPPRAQRRTHHLHVCEPSCQMLRQLAFRDYLVAHPAIAQEYAELKKRLATEHRNDREAYTAAKAEFIAKAVHAAGAGL